MMATGIDAGEMPALTRPSGTYYRREKVSHIEPGAAKDDDGRPVRLRVYSRCCGTGLFAGYHDFDGGVWRTRLFEGPGEDAEMVQRCPGCGSRLFREEFSDSGTSSHHLANVFTMGEVDAVLAKERERHCAGEAFDERTMAALSCELGEGLTFEEAAPLYGRTVEELRGELEAWLDGGNNQIA